MRSTTDTSAYRASAGTIHAVTYGPNRRVGAVGSFVVRVDPATRQQLAVTAAVEVVHPLERGDLLRGGGGRQMTGAVPVLGHDAQAVQRRLRAQAGQRVRVEGAVGVHDRDARASSSGRLARGDEIDEDPSGPVRGSAAPTRTE